MHLVTGNWTPTTYILCNNAKAKGTSVLIIRCHVGSEEYPWDGYTVC